MYFHYTTVWRTLGWTCWTPTPPAEMILYYLSQFGAPELTRIEDDELVSLGLAVLRLRDTLLRLVHCGLVGQEVSRTCQRLKTELM